MSKKLSKYFALSLIPLGMVAKADTATDTDILDVFTKAHVDGEIRMYDFNRSYSGSNQAKPSAHALASSLLLNINSGSFYGFSVGTSFAGVSDLGSRDDNPLRVDTTLMGSRKSFDAVTQAFLQYKNDWAQIRGGYQYLNTPWMSGSDSRMVPASYNAISATFTPIKGWDITLIREFSWRSRVSDSYEHDNLYYPATYNGDDLYGGNNSLPTKTHHARGSYVVGSTYTNGGLKTQAWFYDFQNFAHMTYVDGSYTYRTGTGFDPVIGGQFVYETSGNNNYLKNSTGKLNTVVGGDKVKGRAWGLDLGLVIPDGRLDLYYNKLNRDNNAVGGGALVSPYTVGYASDPLYTTSMIRGLTELGPGHAWKTKFTYNLFSNYFGNRLQFTTAYAKYKTEYYGESHDLYADLTYNFDGFLKGLSVRDRWERSTGGKNNLNPVNRPFTYNRVMVSYKF